MLQKNKKRLLIIAAIIGSGTLIGVGAWGTIIFVVTYNLDAKQTLETALPLVQRNLGTIETNGQQLTEDMIKNKLPTSIDKSQVDIKIDQNNKATIKPINNSTKYKGNVVVTYNLDAKQTLETALPLVQSNLGTIETNGQQLTEDMIKNKLPTSIDKSQVDIKIDQNNKATIKPINNSTKYKGNVVVTYNLDAKQTLETALPLVQSNLGTIETNGQQLTEDMIKNKLPTSIDKSQVDIKIDQNNKATIKPINNSTKYKGNVVVTYNLDAKQTLKTALPLVQSNLGTIETNGQQLTEDMIKNKLPTSIDKSQVDIKIDQNNKATIKPINNSTKYKGNVVVTYNLDAKQTLETALPLVQSNLGTIETNGQQLTEDMIKNKLPTSIDKSQVDIKIDQNNKATIKPINNSTKYKGNVVVTYNLDAKQTLKTALPLVQSNLGTIETNGQQLTEDMIKNKLPTSIDKSQVDIKIDQNNKATIKPINNSTKYKGNVVVTYNLDAKQTLKTALPLVQSNLGTIETNGQQLTEDMIKNKLPTSIDKSQVDIKIDQNNKATIKPINNSTKYKGNVVVTYNLDAKQTLKTALPLVQSNLGTIETNGQQLTEDMIKNKLPTSIDKSQVDIKIDQNNKATIKPINNSTKYKGNVVVTYNLDAKQTLKTALPLVQSNLGTIETNGQQLTEDMIKNKLPTSIDKSQVDIKIDQNNKATIKPINNSTKYKGNVVVTYNLDAKQTLKTALPLVQSNLGTIETNGQQLTEDMIKNKLPTSIDKSQVDIKIDQNNKATIKPINNSTKYKGNVVVTYNLDAKQTLKTALPLVQSNLGTIETNGQQLTEDMIKNKLPTSIDKSQVDIKIDQNNKATIKPINNSTKYKGNVVVTYNLDAKQTLKTALPLVQSNLGTIETNGQQLTEDMIKNKLPTSIDKSQVDIKIDQNNKATIKPINNSTKYKGNVVVTYNLDAKQTLKTALPLVQSNLGTIETNGQQLTEDMIKNKLPTSIDKSQVDIKIDQNNKATIKPINNSTKYKGNVVVTYNLDAKQTLKTALPLVQRNLGTIETNGQQLTEDMIKNKLPTSIDKSQVDIKIDQNNKATIKPINNSTKYKGNVVVTYNLDAKQTLKTALPLVQSNT